MKKITLLFIVLITSVTMFAQGVYVVDICGTIANANGGEQVDINFFGDVNGAVSVTADSTGNWCIYYTFIDSVGAGLDFNYLAWQSNCWAGDTVQGVWLTADTSFTSNWNNCASSNCSVSVFDSAGTLLAYPMSGQSPYAYSWNDGTTGNIAFPNGFMSTYCVTMTDATGCASSTCYTVTTTSCSVSIYDSAGVALYAIPSSGTAPYTYLWSDSSTSNYTFVNGASSTYCVTMTDAAGCVSSDCYTVSSGSNCDVSYSYYPDSVGYSIDFSATATGTAPFTYVWDFGDGSTGTGQYVNNQYAPSGGATTYLACVTITDAAGCSSTDCQYVVVGNPNQPICDVLMSYYQDSTNNATVILDAYPTGVAPFTYTWYFSDGTVSTTTTSTTTHNFTQGSGWDWACVEVIDANGCYSSYCDYIQITNVNTSWCYADFYATFDDVNGNPGEVFFWDWSYGSGNIVSWDWDLGNGQTSTLQNPVTTYSVAGYYTVCLTTTDASGCTDSYCQTCYIDPAWWSNNPWNTGNGGCTANFVAMQDSTLPGMIYLIDLSLGSNLYYTWDFGNGVLINNQYPAVTFTNFGSYNLCLTITDTLAGCTDTYCDTLMIDSLGNLNKLSNWGISVIPSPMPQSVTSVEETIHSESSLSVYPNPTSRDVNVMVSLTEAEVVNVQMLDVTGKVISTNQVIMSGGSNTFELETGQLPNGVYFVNVKSSQVNETERVIVQH